MLEDGSCLKSNSSTELVQEALFERSSTTGSALASALDVVVSACSGTKLHTSSNMIDDSVGSENGSIPESGRNTHKTMYDFKEEECVEQRVLRRKPKRRAHEKLKDRWMREENIRRQQEERKAVFECQLKHQNQPCHKRKRLTDESIFDKEKCVASLTAVVSPLPTQAQQQSSSSTSVSPKEYDGVSMSSSIADDSSLSIKIKINRVSQANGSYQVQLVDGLSNDADTLLTSVLPSSAAAAAVVVTKSAKSKEKSSGKKKRTSVNKSRSSRTSKSPPLTRVDVCTSSTTPTPVPSGKLLRSCLYEGRRLRIGDVVWGKILGWPWWPCQILKLERVASSEHCMACVQWYNWDQVSFLPVDKLYTFLDNFDSKFNKHKKGTYKTAVEQAWAAAQAVRAEHTGETEDEDEEEDIVSDLKQQLEISNNSSSNAVEIVEGGDKIEDVKGSSCCRRRSSSSVIDGQSAVTDEEQHQEPSFDTLQSLDSGGTLNLLPDLGANFGRELGQIAAVDIPTFSDDEDDDERRLIIDTDADRIMDCIDS